MLKLHHTIHWQHTTQELLHYRSKVQLTQQPEMLFKEKGKKKKKKKKAVLWCYPSPSILSAKAGCNLQQLLSPLFTLSIPKMFSPLQKKKKRKGKKKQKY